MKYTLLDLTQNILSSMDSDEVNSINDTVESQQVAKVIRSTYFDIINRANLPEHYSLVNLEPSLDPLKPVLMYIPDEVDQVKWIKYDWATVNNPEINLMEIQPMSVEDFFSRMYLQNTSNPDIASFIHTIGTSTFTIVYRNSVAPDYFTTFDDHTLIFNSFDSQIESTLQSSRSLAYARMKIPFTMSDTFTPDMDDHQFALLLNEAKSLAWAELKQSPHLKAEQSAKRGWSYLQRSKVASEDLSDFEKLPSFGRKY